MQNIINQVTYFSIIWFSKKGLKLNISRQNTKIIIITLIRYFNKIIKKIIFITPLKINNLKKPLCLTCENTIEMNWERYGKKN